MQGLIYDGTNLEKRMANHFYSKKDRPKGTHDGWPGADSYGGRTEKKSSGGALKRRHLG